MIERVSLFGMQVDAVRMPQAVGRVLGWVRQREGVCRYVVTPNVDHAVLFQQHDELRAAYAAASLVLADGAPVVVASRLLGQPLPERVAGSDLVPRLFDAANETGGLRVFLLGGAAGVALRAAEKMAVRWPHIQVVGIASPPLGFENDASENALLLAAISEARPDVVLVCLGAPKQEVWVFKHRRQLTASVALCVGATIDFLAGERSRAPRWMRRVGLEWLHRLASEPRRLLRRYVRDAWLFPQLVWEQWRRGPIRHGGRA